MVSPERPICAAAPNQPDGPNPNMARLHHTPAVWCRKTSRAVPTCTRVHNASQPTDHGVAGAFHLSSCPKPTRWMVSPKRPKRGSPTLHDTTTPHTHRMVSQSVPSGSDLHLCANRCLLTDHGIAGASRDRQRSQTLLECATPGRSSQCGSCNNLGFPIPTTKMVHPGVCGTWPLLTVKDPRFSWVHRQPSTHLWSLLECAAHGRSSQCGTRGVDQTTSPSGLQIDELRKVPLLHSSTRLRLEYGVTPLTPSTPPHNPLRKPATRPAASARSASPASGGVVNSVTSVLAFSSALLNSASWSSRACLSTTIG